MKKEIVSSDVRYKSLDSKTFSDLFLFRMYSRVSSVLLEEDGLRHPLGDLRLLAEQLLHVLVLCSFTLRHKLPKRAQST